MIYATLWLTNLGPEIQEILYKEIVINILRFMWSYPRYFYPDAYDAVQGS